MSLPSALPASVIAILCWRSGGAFFTSFKIRLAILPGNSPSILLTSFFRRISEESLFKTRTAACSPFAGTSFINDRRAAVFRPITSLAGSSLPGNFISCGLRSYRNLSIAGAADGNPYFPAISIAKRCRVIADKDCPPAKGFVLKIFSASDFPQAVSCAFSLSPRCAIPSCMPLNIRIFRLSGRLSRTAMITAESRVL